MSSSVALSGVEISGVEILGVEISGADVVVPAESSVCSPLSFELSSSVQIKKTHNKCYLRGSFFMFVESGCISTNIEFTVP